MRRLIVNGSFVTAKVEPIDVDVILLPNPDRPTAGQAEVLWPFLQIIVAADEADLEACTSKQIRPGAWPSGCGTCAERHERIGFTIESQNNTPRSP